MLTIEKSSTFQQEYKKFNEQIASITNVEFRQECEGLLKNLLMEVRKLDTLHVDLTPNNRLPSGTTDSRYTIAETRKILVNKLRDWREAVSKS